MPEWGRIGLSPEKCNMKMKTYQLHLADRSSHNESVAKEVYGTITETNDDKIICYVPNSRMAALVLQSLKCNMKHNNNAIYMY